MAKRGGILQLGWMVTFIFQATQAHSA